jgi:hypothetical protein
VLLAWVATQAIIGGEIAEAAREDQKKAVGAGGLKEIHHDARGRKLAASTETLCSSEARGNGPKESFGRARPRGLERRCLVLRYKPDLQMRDHA